MADNFEATSLSPVQAAEAAAKLVVESTKASVAEQARKDWEESYKIVDPGQPDKGKEETTTAQETATKPTTIPGASPDGGLTPRMLERLRDAGIGEAEAKQTPPAVLERLLERYERQPEPVYEPPQPYYDANGNYFDGQNWWSAEQVRAYQNQNAPQFPDLKGFKDPDDGTVIHPLLIESLEARDNYYMNVLQQTQQQLQQTQQLLNQQHQTQAARENADLNRQLNDSIAKDADYHDVLGDGNFHQASRAQQEACEELASLMNAIATQRQQMGRPPLPHESLYKQARTAMYGDRAQTKVTTERMRNAAGQFVAKPTATTRDSSWESMPKGEARAVAAVAERMRHGPRG